MRCPPAVWCAACFVSLALAAEPPARAENAGALTVDQIIAKNATARGGLEAWRKIHTMIWTGHIQSAHAPVPEMPFVLEMRRPDQTHFEIKVQGETATRVFNGVQGWKQRPTATGRPEMLPYTAEELRFARDAPGMDGPLIDHQAKGIAVALEGTDEVEGRKAYRLNVKLPSGTTYHLWVDAETFLDAKYDRPVRNGLGQPGTVSVFYRDYRAVGGVQLPFIIETTAGDTATGNKSGRSGTSDKMVIDRVVLNLPLGNLAFSRPALFDRRNEVSVDIPPQSAAAFPPRGPSRLSRPAYAVPAMPH